MKFVYLFALSMLLSSFLMHAQDKEHPVKWVFSLEKVADNLYAVNAEAILAPGFHIWALDPGGDGSLIPTSFAFDDEQKMRWRGDWKESPEGERQELEYVDGAIFWHEHKVIFTRSFVCETPMPINGRVHFQVCSAQSCFPPEERTIKLQVR